MADNDSTSLSKKQLIVSALCKHLSLDYNTFSGDAVDNDLKSLYKTLISSADGSPTQNNDQMMKWIAFAEDFPTDYEAAFEALNALNEDLIQISVLLGNGLKPSAADVIVFSAIYSFVTGLSDSDRKKLLHVMRWMDYIQNKGNIGVMFEKILVEKRVYEPQLQGQGVKPIGKVEPESDAKKTVQSGKSADKQAELSTKKSDTMKKATEIKAPTQEKKKASETTTVDKEKEVSVSLLNIQVGLIRKAWKHPSADSLLVEEIDTGDAKFRQVVSGLAKYCNLEDLTNRHVVLITNVKPGKLRDVLSEGLVLCASSEDHTVVEPLRPPEGAKAGEQISFDGIDGKPEDVLNPKKKQLDKITPHLYTDEKGVATYKGIPFMTSAGPCTSSIPKASIK